MRLVMIFVAFIALSALSLTALSWALQPTSAGIAQAPHPTEHPQAIVQVYGADVWGVRGHFAIHTWIATKAANSDRYLRYQVIGWRARRGQPVVSITEGNPDGDWFGSEPVLLHERRGAEAERIIDAIHQAALRYPYAKEYVMWPGPNSNSFIAWIGLEVPDFDLDLPAKALGKTWMIDNYGS